MKRILDEFTTMDLIGLGGVLSVIVIGLIFLAKEWGLM